MPAQVEWEGANKDNHWGFKYAGIVGHVFKNPSKPKTYYGGCNAPNVEHPGQGLAYEFECASWDEAKEKALAAVRAAVKKCAEAWRNT